MNKDFEAIVMNTYAELCIMWRVAHVTDQDQAKDFDAKLQSLEAVVAAFDLNTAGELVGEQESAPVEAQPQPARQNTPVAHEADADGGLFGN